MAAYEHLELDRQLCFALHRASRAVVRSYGSLLGGSGLTYTQYLVLLVLWEEHPRPFTVGEIGARLHLDSGTLTPLLKRLEGLGHLRRRRDMADERRVLVELTEGGLALREELAEVPSLWSSGLGLGPEQAGYLHEELNGLAARLEALEQAAEGT